MKLHAEKFGLACGILWGASLFVLTFIALWTGYATDFLKIIESVYPGYSVSASGSFVGLVEGFIDGFVGSWIFAAIYNKLIK